ncbi:uncharacterized protein CCR75_003075 [Bremia lactucae]|uniref:Uncharacterized protein n=1 Tax=Bremia lactucae TaxID=4779 RepID=A0A976IK26_BRELC|nr:hypothetical protein CCR75_003075 [Bremia lactucae]
MADLEELTPTSNPYLDFHRKFVREHPGNLSAVFDPKLSDESRSEMYAALDISLAMKYSWAIPDERALQIIKSFGPIVEMGAGNGYWARLLQLRDVDIIAYDHRVAGDEEEKEEKSISGEESDGVAHEASVSSDEEVIEDTENVNEEVVDVEQIIWTDVRKGTPKDLRKHTNRTLFLCYPDDFEDSQESMAMASLCNYEGSFVIHVGELFGQTICLPNPWGRTSSEEFQIHLATVYHKVLQVPLPSWHSSIDTLTVWKRTQSSINNGAMYAFIPEDERIDLVAASPSLRHLLLVDKVNVESDMTLESNKRQRDNSKAKQAERNDHLSL